MNTSMKALIISLAFHGAFLSLVYALSVGFAQPCKPIRIDFTVNDSAHRAAFPETARCDILESARADAAENTPKAGAEG